MRAESKARALCKNYTTIISSASLHVSIEGLLYTLEVLRAHHLFVDVAIAAAMVSAGRDNSLLDNKKCVLICFVVSLANCQYGFGKYLALLHLKRRNG